MSATPYHRFARRLDALPNGFPATPDGAEIRLLEKICDPEEADLAADLRLTLETPAEIAARTGRDPKPLRKLLKSMARKGVIKAGRAASGSGMGYGLLPFVVGIYEMQIARLDAEMAQLFEDYYQRAFGSGLMMQPSVHRVIPVQESVRVDMEIRPYENAAEIVQGAQSWGVVDCICRKQKLLIDDPCEHPVEDICMVLGETPGLFDHTPAVKALSKREALGTLERAAEAGLVHSVSNNQQGLWYICNCCTCSCGVLRGIAQLGIANVVARAAFVNTVNEDICIGCEDCIDDCQFGALALDGAVMAVNQQRCVGCGVCVIKCPEEAMSLIRRADVAPPPLTETDWQIERARVRGIDMDRIR
ncbi:MAG: 4Fe-4S ferredoxin [Chloroflexi bacterium]|nr:4Fe-4S ferredoxin [Chloroflexota bacterium]